MSDKHPWKNLLLTNINKTPLEILETVDKILYILSFGLYEINETIDKNIEIINDIYNNEKNKDYKNLMKYLLNNIKYLDSSNENNENRYFVFY